MVEILIFVITLLVVDYWHHVRQYKLIKHLRKVCDANATTDDGFKNGLAYAIEQIKKF